MQKDETKLAFGEVEQILYELFGLHGAGRASFRARVTRLGAMGVPVQAKARPGKRGGGKIDYSVDDVLQLALAMHLQSIGVTPATAAGLLTGRGFWLSLKGLIDDIGDDPDGRLYVVPSAPWVPADEDTGFRLMAIKRDATEPFDSVAEIKVGRITAKINAAIAALPRLAASEAPDTAAITGKR